MLLNRAASLDTGDRAVVGMLGDGAAAWASAIGNGRAVVGVVDGGGKVGDVLGDRVLGADGTSIYAVALAGLGHGIVARIEVFAVLEMLGEVVGAGRELSVEAEETLLLWGEVLL